MQYTVEIMSRDDMVELMKKGRLENTAVISFFDPSGERGLGSLKGYGPIDFKGCCDRCFSVGIHDIDFDSLEEYGLTYDTYFPECSTLAEFIISAIYDGFNIICQCEHGQSRSAACAAAIKEYYDKTGIEIFADYRYYPNKMIFKKLSDELRQMTNKKGEGRIW